MIRVFGAPMGPGFARKTDIVRAIFQDASPGLSIFIEEAIKANEAALGPELVTNGDFSTGTAGWTTGGSTIASVDGELQVTGASANFPSARQAVPVTVGKTYRVSASYRSVGNSAPAAMLFRPQGYDTSTGQVSSTTSTSTSPSLVVGTLYATTSSLYLRATCYENASTGTVAFDNISVREIDLSKCRAFQDSVGTLPVVAMEQPLGLVLDNSQGLVRGPELLANGGFDSATGWTINPPWEISGGQANASGAAAGVDLLRSFGAVNEKWYEYICNVTVVSGSIRPQLEENLGPVLTTSGTYRIVLKAPNSNARLILRPVSTFTGSVNNFSIRELPGNHLYNPASSTNRPVVSRRVNLIGSTEDLQSATWTKSAGVVTGSNLFVPNTANAIHRVHHPAVFALGASYVVHARLKNEGVRYVYVNTNATLGARVGVDLTTGATVTAGTGVSDVSVVVNADGWVDISYRGIGTGVSGNYLYFQASLALVAGDTTYAADGTSGFRVEKVDARLLSDTTASVPAYQTVRSAADYDEVGFPAYAQFDGLGDWLETGAIDMTSTDVVTVVASMTKLSDSVEQMLAEFSGSSGTINGAFALWANIATGSAIRFRSRGTSNADMVPPLLFPAGTKAILGGVGNITAPSISVRSNGVELASSGASQGTGSYGNHKLYVGRRNGATIPFKGRVYGLTVIGKLLSESQLLGLEAKHHNNGKVY